MTLTKQTVHLPVKVEDELPTHKVCALNDSNMLVGHLKHLGKGVIRPIVYVEDEHQEMGNVTHWLKSQEGYFFTPEQLNEYTANVIKQALETVADNAKVVEEELGSDEYREIPIDTFESSEFIADKGYEECSFYRYKVSKQSITNTFEETYKKFEV